MIEERAILAVLERIARMQDSIRSGMDICRDTGLVFLRVYYEQLPPNVARRLTELHAEDMAEKPAGPVLIHQLWELRVQLRKIRPELPFLVRHALPVLRNTAPGAERAAGVVDPIMRIT